MPLPDLLDRAIGWLAWSGLALALLTLVAFAGRWGVRFRLVGVTSFTLLLSVSCWAFDISYHPPVLVEGAMRAPVVFDNGDDLVVAQAQTGIRAEAVAPTLAQLAANLRTGGRGSQEVTVRLRQLESGPEGSSIPVVLGETIVPQSMR